MVLIGAVLAASVAATILYFALRPPAPKRQLLRLVNSAIRLAASEDRDYLDDQRIQLHFQDIRSLESIKKMITDSAIEDITNVALMTWPTPFYYINNQEIGGYGQFVCHVGEKIYLLRPRQSYYLFTYGEKLSRGEVVEYLKLDD